MLKRAMGGLLLGASLTVGAAPAAQAQDVFSTWLFTANCIDCAMDAKESEYPVTATLLLKNYSQKQGFSPLSSTNFVSFSYAGSNLIPGGFSVDKADVTYVFGDLFATVQSFDLRWSSSKGSGFFLMPFYSLSFTATLDEDGFTPIAADPGTWGTCVSAQQNAFCVPVVFENALDFGDQGKFTLQTSTVPEPSTYALMGVGLVAIGFVSRKRRA